MTVPLNELPEPYADWDVQVTPVDGNQQVLHLTFNSPLLGQRITNTVHVPDRYRRTGPQTPVMYSLHGTVFSPIDNCALNQVTGQLTLLRMLACGGGYLQDKLYNVPSQLSEMNFMVVSPDTNPQNSICETCVWIDGRDDLLPNIHPITAKTLPTDSFLHQELYPLVETLFNVRNDRGGRGVIGFSMGGWAALLQGMIHPDKYAYGASVSGVYDIKEPVIQTTLANPIGYLRDQGYGTSVTHPVWWRQYNPKGIVQNIKNTDVKLFLSSGNGCVNPLDLLTEEKCQGEYSPTRAPLGLVVESELSLNRMIAVRDLKSKGIDFQAVQTPGTHGANNAEMFAKYVIPGANKKFSSQTTKPETFFYKTAIPQFSIWGYDVAVERTKPVFLSMSKARTDGRSFTLAGAGSATVTTPDKFEPGQTYTVTISSHDGQRSQHSVTAGKQGRVSVNVDLHGDKPVTVKVR